MATKMSSNEGVKKELITVNLNQVMNYEGPVDPILKGIQVFAVTLLENCIYVSYVIQL